MTNRNKFIAATLLVLVGGLGVYFGFVRSRTTSETEGSETASDRSRQRPSQDQASETTERLPPVRRQPAPRVRPQTEVVVTGAVTDAISNTPVASAEVVFDSGATYSAATDAQGQYKLKLKPGQYNISAAGENLVGSAGRVAISSAAEQTVNIAVSRTASVHGVVVDANGSPIEGIELDAFVRSDDRLRSFAQLWELGVEPAQNVTDEDGAFAFALLTGKPVLISAKSPAGALADIWLKKVEPGGSYQARLVLDASARITGRVKLADGSAAEGVTVYAISRGKAKQKHVQRTYTDELGQYTFDEIAPHSRVVVEARLKDIGQSRPAKLVIENGDHKTIDLAFTAPQSLSGRVIDHTRAPISGIDVFALGRDSEVWLRTVSDSDGKFRFDGIAASTYTVGAQDKAHGRIALHGVDSGTQDLQVKFADK